MTLWFKLLYYIHNLNNSLNKENKMNIVKTETNILNKLFSSFGVFLLKDFYFCKNENKYVYLLVGNKMNILEFFAKNNICEKMELN